MTPVLIKERETYGGNWVTIYSINDSIGGAFSKFPYYLIKVSNIFDMIAIINSFITQKVNILSIRFRYDLEST